MLKRSKKKKSAIGRNLVKKHADMISIDDKEKWKEVPGKRENGVGVYALYNNYGLYYIGKGTSIKKRLTTHKRSKTKRWNKYSWYQTKNIEDAEELEAIILRITNPPENKQSARSKDRKKEKLEIKK